MQFTSSVTKIFSLVPRAALQASSGDYRGAIRSIAGFSGALVSAAIVREVVGEIRNALRGKDEEKDEERLRERVSLGIARELSGYPLILGNILQPIVNQAIDGSTFRFSSSTLESFLGDVARAGIAVTEAVQATMSQELDSDRELKWRKKWLTALNKSAGAASKTIGVPYRGLQDIYYAIRTWIYF